MDRPTHDWLVALRQTSWFPREGKMGRREDLARLSFLFPATFSDNADHSKTIPYAFVTVCKGTGLGVSPRRFVF
jgi:hypothetical protein